MERENRLITEELISNIDDEGKFTSIVDGVTPIELVFIQNFLWDYAIKFSKEIGNPLSREQITAGMESTSNYQLRVGCDEPVDYCRANFCVMSNPNCAGDKLKASIKVLREVISELRKNSK